MYQLSRFAGLELMLRWFGVKAGDEVMISAYTYAATANVVEHCGAKVVFVDSDEDFLVSLKSLENALSTQIPRSLSPSILPGSPATIMQFMTLSQALIFKNVFIHPAKNRKH